MGVISLARALLLAVGLVAAQRQVRRHLEDARGGEHGTSMLGLKLASSGSTWWAHELKAQRGIVVEEELFTSTSHLSPKKREDKMVERLARCDGGGACGFTISPKNSPGVDWRRVGRAAGCVVAWERSNLAKTVVSIVRKRVLRVCGGKPNIHPGSKKADCANATAVFRVDDVEALLIEQLEWRVDFEAAVAEAVRDTPCFLRMRYEDFQRNETAELRRLRCALGLGAPDRKDRPVDVAKKTSDDLRDVIENYAEIEAYAAAVEAAAPACPLAAMLRSTGFETFECDVDAALAAARWERAAAGRPDDLAPWKAHANETHPREADVFSSARDVQSGAPAEVVLPGALLAPDHHDR